jgi:hypothetical protein
MCKKRGVILPALGYLNVSIVGYKIFLNIDMENSGT